MIADTGMEKGKAMPEFFVSFMSPIKRARVHRGECSNCNHGRGQLGQDKTGSGATGWSGALSHDEALALAKSYKAKGYTDVDYCGTCLRSSRPLT